MARHAVSSAGGFSNLSHSRGGACPGGPMPHELKRWGGKGAGTHTHMHTRMHTHKARTHARAMALSGISPFCSVDSLHSTSPSHPIFPNSLSPRLPHLPSSLPLARPRSPLYPWRQLSREENSPRFTTTSIINTPKAQNKKLPAAAARVGEALAPLRN